MIACVVPTTPGSTTTTTAGSTLGTVPGAQATTLPEVTTSGTTVAPTSVATTTPCQKNMAIVGEQYVSSISYTTQPITGTINTDLTADKSNGITFPQQPAVSGFTDSSNQPLYVITFNFNAPGVASLGSVAVKPTSDSNVNQFTVEFYALSNPSVPVPLNADSGDTTPLYFTSALKGTIPSIDSFPESYVPSPLIGIRFIVASTTDNL